MGIATPGITKGLLHKQTTGWNSVVVWQLIKSETYCGIWRYGKQVGKSGKGRKRCNDEQIAVNVPAILSRETWELAQERRTHNSRVARRKMKHEYLLRGLIYCGCGRGMVAGGKRSGRKSYLYHCTRRYASGNAVGSEVCTEPLVKGGLIERVTWDYIMGLIKNPIEFEEKLRQAQANEAAKMQPQRKELEHVIALLKKTEIEADEIAHARRKVKGIVGERLQKQEDEVNQRYEALLKRKSDVQADLAVELTDNTIRNLLNYRNAVALVLENPTFEDRRRWLEILQTSVTVTNGMAVVSCRLPVKPLEYNLFELQTG